MKAVINYQIPGNNSSYDSNVLDVMNVSWSFATNIFPVSFEGGTGVGGGSRCGFESITSAGARLV